MWTLLQSIFTFCHEKNNKNQNTVNRRTKWAIFHNYVSLLEDEPHWWCMIFHWRITVMYNYFHQFGFPQQIRNNGRTERCGQICKATKTPNPQDQMECTSHNRGFDERDRFFLPCVTNCPCAEVHRHVLWRMYWRIAEYRFDCWGQLHSEDPETCEKTLDFCLGWVKTLWCRIPSDS